MAREHWLGGKRFVRRSFEGRIQTKQYTSCLQQQHVNKWTKQTATETAVNLSTGLTPTNNEQDITLKFTQNYDRPNKLIVTLKHRILENSTATHI